MFHNKKSIVLIVAILLNTMLYAQDREQDTLKTDVINVVKPYSPTISDAFKVKETPSLDDDETATKKEIKYNIFSFPVASTFTPAKGKAAVVDKAEKVKLFNNYASLGVGSYRTILGEVYLNHELSRGENISAYLGHHSSKDGIENMLLDDSFSDSKVNLGYAKQNRDITWRVDGGFQYQHYNWYGLPRAFTKGETPIFTSEMIDTLNVKHNYSNAYIGGDVSVEDSYLTAAKALFRHFGDNLNSAENRFKAEASAEIPILDELINTTVKFDYLGGSFDRNYYTSEAINYNNFNIVIAPTYQIKNDDYTVVLGATPTYLNNIETGKSKFYIYPNITASYRVLDENVIAFGDLKGGLIQNSYYGFTTENQFVSPTLTIAPTDQQYNATLGLKGRITSTTSYSVSGSYKSEKGKALFRNNLVPYDYASEEDYQYGNSFGVVYDAVKTLSGAAEINVDLNRNFTLGLKGEYFVYSSTNEAEAWNLPDFKASLFVDYQIDQHWFAGGSLFLIGERSDLFGYDIIDPTGLSNAENAIQVLTLDPYLDLNLHAGYHINDRFSVFVRGNNLVEQPYDKWQNTKVQGLQFMGGLTYKFDF